MKRILILAYDFPPYNSVGAQRPWSWYKHLKDLGWEPIVITRQWDANIHNPIDYIKSSINQKKTEEKTSFGIIIRTPFNPNLRDKMLLKYGINKYVLMRKVLTFITQIFEHIIPYFDNKKNIYIAAYYFLKKNKVDAIIATGEPFILFKYARKLSDKYSTPWIADYRDGWTNNYGLDNLPKIEQLLRKTVFNRLEKNYLSSSSHIITVSQFLKESLQEKYLLNNISILSNGYNSDELTNESEQNSNVFTITYVGTIYPHQRLEVFLQGFNDFVIKIKPTIALNFIGIDFYEDQKKRVLNYNNNINKYIFTTNRLNKQSYFEKLTSSNILLLLANENVDGSCAKVYDYLLVKRKILLCVNDFKTLEQIIEKTNSGKICHNSEEVTQNLCEAYFEWKKTNVVACNSKNIEQYSRKEQTKELARALHKLVT